MGEQESARAAREARRNITASPGSPGRLDAAARMLGADHYRSVRPATEERATATSPAPETEAETGAESQAEFEAQRRDQARRRQIVAGIDGSTSARAAAIWAGGEAVRHGMTLRLVHVVEVLPTGTESNIVRGLHALGAQWLAETKDVIGRWYADLVVDTELRTGTAVAELIAASRSAAQVVVGSRGLGGLTGLLVGSTAVALAGHGECPVVVVRDLTSVDVAVMSGPVVVGVDGSHAGRAALAAAFEEASLAGTELVAVRAWSDIALTGWGFTAAYTANLDTLAGKAERLLDEQLAPLRPRYPNVPVRPVAVADRPVASLVEQAKDARLLVVGSRGRGGFAGMLLGSVSRNLIQRAPCPLLVVRDSLAG